MNSKHMSQFFQLLFDIAGIGALQRTLLSEAGFLDLTIHFATGNQWPRNSRPDFGWVCVFAGGRAGGIVCARACVCFCFFFFLF